MKKLPKRDGYKPKPLPRAPTLEEVIIRTTAPEIVRIAEESGIDVQEYLRSRRERKDEPGPPSGDGRITLGIRLLKIEVK